MLAAPALLIAGADASRPAPVRIEARIPVDGDRLYLLVRGDDAHAPPLLWLHGGPGGAERPLFRLFNAALEKRFVVGYLDQRGAGRSFRKDADRGRLTVARHLEDLAVVADWMRRTLGADRITLLGHSWGAALGLLFAHRRPDRVAAFLGTGVLVSTLASQRAQVEFVQAQARSRDDEEVLRTVAGLGPPPLAWRDDLRLQALVDRYGGYFHQRPSFAWATVRALAQGLVSPGEIGRIIQGNDASLEAMNAELARLDLRQEIQELKVPVGFLLGRHDRKTDSRIASEWLAELAAPRKRLVWFEDSAHNPPFEEPDAFNATVPRVLAELGVLPTCSLALADLRTSEKIMLAR